jgi:hypothetical protein
MIRLTLKVILVAAAIVAIYAIFTATTPTGALFLFGGR